MFEINGIKIGGTEIIGIQVHLRIFIKYIDCWMYL